MTDKGGRSRTVAFTIFIVLLADAYGSATGQRATLTWDDFNQCYKGPFWEMIEAVLPKARAIVRHGGFAAAGKAARGRQVQRILSAMDKTFVSNR